MDKDRLKIVVSNRDSYEQLHKTACEMARQLSLKKNADYAGWEDPFYNFHDGGELGILIRLGDKYKRLLNFEKRALNDPKHEMKVSDEAVEDTVLDLINYSILYLGYKYRDRKPLP